MELDETIAEIKRIKCILRDLKYKIEENEKQMIEENIPFADEAEMMKEFY